jgi:propionate catabolism operon transcriptional regulator
LLQFTDPGGIDYDALRDDCPELFVAEGAAHGDDAGDIKARLLQQLRLSNGNRALAAQSLGISRSTLWRWMKEAGAD